jgi:tRNA(adenine34) deaminase
MDEFYMQEALKEAQKGFLLDEVPVGAVLVFQNKIIARAHNQVESLNDATAHAEMVCLKEGTKILGNWRLCETTLYCTLEPCPMCAGALALSRVKRVVWGAPMERACAVHTVSASEGVLQEECGQLLKQFFREKRWKNCSTSS